MVTSFLLPTLLLAAPEYPAPLELLRLLDGEELEYIGRVYKAGISMDVGRARFRVRAGRDGDLHLEAMASGSKFGYTLDARVMSLLTTGVEGGEKLDVRLHRLTQAGSKKSGQEIIFKPGEWLYRKKKHCRDPKCRDPNHFMTKTKWVGPIPWSSQRKHCRHCSRWKHKVWLKRGGGELPKGFVDPVTAVYLTRFLEVPMERPGAKVPVVINRNLWKVEVWGLKEETIEVEAGEFRTIRIALEPQPVTDGAEVRDEFEGLFGLKGAMEIWIDRETHRPIRIHGILPFGPIDLNIEVRLASVDSEPRHAGDNAAAVKGNPGG